jgi:hypothetical protein
MRVQRANQAWVAVLRRSDLVVRRARDQRNDILEIQVFLANWRLHFPAFENFAMQIHLIDASLCLAAIARMDYQIVDRQSTAGADSDCKLDQFVRGQSHSGNSSLCNAGGPAGREKHATGATFASTSMTNGDISRGRRFVRLFHTTMHPAVIFRGGFRMNIVDSELARAESVWNDIALE